MKFICSLLLTLIFVFAPCGKASTIFAYETEPKYSRVLTTTTAFYSDSGGNNLKFYLPYGYYVKIIEVGTIYSKVTYMNENSQFPFLTGFIKTLDLITQDTIPITPYPLISLTVITDDVLFTDSNLINSKIGVYQNTLAVYYGEITNQNEVPLVYVFCNGYLGYMRKSCFAPFVVPTHPTPIEQPNEPTTSEPPKPENSNSIENLQILIVAGISVIVVSIVYFIFRPNGKRVKETYYEDN